MNRVFFLIVICIALFFSGCETAIEFKGEEADPKIVVYSTLHPDSLIQCDIGTSYPIFDPEYKPEQIKDAEVRLYADNELLATLTYQEPPEKEYYLPLYLSKYTSNHYPEEDREYRIEVSLPTYKTVTSSTKLTRIIPVTRLDTQKIWVNEYDWSYPELKTAIVFSDPADEENYYRLNINRITGYYPGDRSLPYDPEIPVLVTRERQIYFQSNDPVLSPPEEEGIFESSGGNMFLVFSDEKINGREYELHFRLDFAGNMYDYDYNEFCYFEIVLQSVSKELYLFLVSSSMQRYVEDDFFSEPVLIYSNIQNGLGVFGSFNGESNWIRYGEYPIEGVLYESPESYYGGGYIID